MHSWPRHYTEVSGPNVIYWNTVRSYNDAVSISRGYRGWTVWENDHERWYIKRRNTMVWRSCLVFVRVRAPNSVHKPANRALNQSHQTGYDCLFPHPSYSIIAFENIQQKQLKWYHWINQETVEIIWGSGSGLSWSTWRWCSAILGKDDR